MFARALLPLAIAATCCLDYAWAQFPLGSCGTEFGPCSGAAPCCSAYGYCGADPAAFCGTGCQSAYSAPGSCLRMPNVYTNCVVPGTIAITFDDGPYIYTASIAAQFTAAGANVTFFENGLNYACLFDYAEVVKNLTRSGHQIGSHTWSHANLSTLTSSEVATEINLLSIAFRKILGFSPAFLRPPYGDYRDVSTGGGRVSA